MTQDNQSEIETTTTPSQTIESSVSSIYHEKRATSLEKTEPTQADDTGRKHHNFLDFTVSP